MEQVKGQTLKDNDEIVFLIVGTTEIPNEWISLSIMSRWFLFRLLFPKDFDI